MGTYPGVMFGVRLLLALIQPDMGPIQMLTTCYDTVEMTKRAEMLYPEIVVESPRIEKVCAMLKASIEADDRDRTRMITNFIRHGMPKAKPRVKVEQTEPSDPEPQP